MGCSLAFSLKEDPVRCVKVFDKSWVVLKSLLNVILCYHLIFSELMAKIRESEEHSKSKIMEHFLSGFKPDDSDWIIFLADVFFDIFCNYNYQMISLLKHPVDAWSKARTTT